MDNTKVQLAIVTYSDPTTGDIRVSIPALFGPNDVPISRIGREPTEVNGVNFWKVPEVGTRVLAVPEDDSYSNIFIAKYDNPNIVHYSETPPTNPMIGDSWVRSTDGTASIWNGSTWHVYGSGTGPTDQVFYPVSSEPKIRLVGDGGEQTPGGDATDSEIQLELVAGNYGNELRSIFMVRDHLNSPITWIRNDGGGLITTDNIKFKDGSFNDLIRLMFTRASTRKYPAIVFGSDGAFDASSYRTIYDGVTTLGSSTISSATANFTSTDQGRCVIGTGIPDNAQIVEVVSTSVVTLSHAATVSATGVSLLITDTDVFTGTALYRSTYNYKAALYARVNRKNILRLMDDQAMVYGDLKVTGAVDFNSWSTWSPTVSGVTNFGSGATTVYRYTEIGRTVFCWSRIVFGTGISASGGFKLSLPVPANSTIINNPMGRFRTTTLSGTPYVGTILLNSGSNTADFIIDDVSGTYPTLGTALSQGTPITWSNLSSINSSWWYEKE